MEPSESSSGGESVQFKSDSARKDDDEIGQRRIAVIMFTDMVGYTALAQTDEGQALEVLERHNKLLRPFFSKYHGREVKTIGDSFLVEFESALEAALCAVEIQKFLHDYNVSTHEDWKIKLRIGIHLGDVVRKGEDILGDAVNIASRIQPLAAPEGVCISRQVFDQIHNKISYPFEQLEKGELKNVQFQTSVYSIVLPWEERKSFRTETESSELDRLRVAVLPFSSMSADPNDEYFADGITEELISTISRISGLRIISRTSVMQYKNTTKQILEIGHNLKVGTVIEGSVRKSGNRIRITIQLIDVQTDEHLWSERYDRELEDIFEIQSKIAQQVAESLKVQLIKEEKKQVKRISTTNTEAYTLYLKARYAWTERTELGITKAIEYLKLAVEKDSNFALAYSGLADCYTASAVYGHLQEGALTKAKEHALKAVEIDDSLAEAHNSLAVNLGFENKWIESRKEFKRAIELNQNYETAHHWYAQLLAAFGEFEEAIAEAEKARQLDPLSPTTSVTLAMVFLYTGVPERAVEELCSYLEMNPNYLPASLWLGISYIVEAKFVEAIAKIKPTIDHLPISRAALGYAYARAGMKEEAQNQISELVKTAKTQYEFAGIASIYLAMGMKEESSRVLENAFPNGSREPDSRYKIFPWWLSDIWQDEVFHEIKNNVKSS